MNSGVPLSRPLQPHFNAGSGLRSPLDKDDLTNSHKKNRITNESSFGMANMLQRHERMIAQLRRRIISPPSTNSSTSGAFNIRGHYYADNLNVFPNNTFAVGDVVYMDDNPEGYTPVAPWGVNAIGGRINAVAGATDVSFTLTPYDGQPGGTTNTVINFNWRYLIYCVTAVSYSGGKFLQLIVPNTGVPGVIAPPEVTSGIAGGAFPVDENWIVLAVAEAFLKVESP